MSVKQLLLRCSWPQEGVLVMDANSVGVQNKYISGVNWSCVRTRRRSDLDRRRAHGDVQMRRNELSENAATLVLR